MGLFGFKQGKIRDDFTILNSNINGKPIIYMDSACMSLRPKQVVDAVVQYYNEFPACGGRSMHKLARDVTEKVDETRKTAQKFFNARNREEIVFTKNATEGINLVAHSIGLKKGDVVLTTDKEHNSNLLPWQILAERGIKHKIVESNPDSTFSLENLKSKMNKNVRLVSMVHTSNMDGSTIPAKEIIKIAHDNGSSVMLDGAQSAPHKQVDVKKLGVDFFACSGHKMLGPGGTGILYGKLDILNKMKPFIIGGETVKDSTYTSRKLEDAPEKFEAGLQNYPGIIGLGEALRYLKKIGLDNIAKHEHRLNKMITDELISDVKLLGPEDPRLRGGIFSFNIEGIDPHNIALVLDQSDNIMMRSGAHCVHSWFNAHKMKGSARASSYIYNTEEECRLFVDAIKRFIKHFKK